MDRATLRDRYEAACSTPSDIYLHLPRLFDFVVSRNARHVIELGTRSGVSTVAFLHALEQTGGRLTSVDLDAAPPIGTYPHWNFVQGDDMSPDVLRSLAPADIVFIDTSHFYDHTLAELHAYQYLIRDTGGLIVLHDTELPRPEGAPPFPLYPVKRAVTEYCARTRRTWANYPECWGLGVIEFERGLGL